jgi:hypothetical protein
VVISAGRSPFRVADLLELSTLIARQKEGLRGMPRGRKPKSVSRK